MAYTPEKRDEIANAIGSALTIALVASVGFISWPEKATVDRKMEAERLRIRAILRATTNAVPVLSSTKEPRDTTK